MEDIIKYDNLKTKVMKYILYKKRTESEIRQKFVNEDENLLEDVIDYLVDAGYINDEVYVERAINEFVNLKNMSIKEISYKLYQKGVKRTAVEKYMNNNIEYLEEYERKSAKKIFQKKCSNMEINDIIIYLKKKGYTEESIEYAKVNE